MNWTSKIGLGSVQFGLPYGISNTEGQTSDKDVSEILEVAFQNGITTIDTAPSYGTAEKIIGNYQKNRFDIVTKFMPSNHGVSIKKQFVRSLEYLKVSSLHGYLAHRPLELVNNRKDWEEMQKLKSSKKISKIGFSLNEPSEYYQLLKADMIPDIVQVPFNYFDSRFEEILIELQSKGCETHIRSVFLQGLFFIKSNNLPKFFEPFFQELQYLQSTFGEKLSSTLLKYTLEKTFVDKVILGVENPSQLEFNIKGLASAVEINDLGKRFSDKILMPMYWPK
jgi:aryl-alcohol dehydrogenase-like predicted oxidoreductase